MLIDFIKEEDLKNEKRLLGNVWELQERLYTYFRPKHQEWRSNWALFSGHHFNRDFIYTNYNSQSDASARKLMWNHVNSLTHRVFSKLTRNKPAIGVIVDEDDLESENDAFIGKALVDYHKRRINYDEIFKQTTLNTIVNGMSCEYLYWNPYAHLDHGKWIGEPAIEVVPMFELFWDPKVKTKDEMRWIIRTKSMKIAYLQKLFPEKKKEIKQTKSYTALNYLTNEKYVPEDEIPVLELFLKPVPEYEKGLHLICTEESILKQDDWLYENFNDLPFFFTHYEKRDSHFFGGSPVTQVRPLQIEVNKIVSHISQNQNQAGRPKVLVPRGANLIDGSISNGITILEFDGPTPPQYIAPQSTPVDVFNFLELCLRNMELLFNVQGTSRGEVPKNVTSGIALQFLVEQEGEVLAPVQQRLEQKNADILEALTKICHEKYDPEDERIIRILGEDNSWRKVSWDRKIEKKYHIIYQPISALPESYTARLQTLFELKQLAPDVITNDVIVESMQLGAFGRMYNELTIDRKLAKAKAHAIKYTKNDGMVARDWENHMVTLRELYLEMKTLALKGYKEDDPIMLKMKDAIEQHELLLAKENFETNMMGSQVSPDQMGGNPLEGGLGAPPPVAGDIPALGASTPMGPITEG